MFRIAQRASSALRAMGKQKMLQPLAVAAVIGRWTHGSQIKETAECFDARYINYFCRQDIDGWEIRKAMNDLCGEDLVPEPNIIVSALKACRRVNDYAMAVRYLEAVKEKCGPREKEIWPYVVSQIRPTLDELGILTPEEMCYHRPELALPDVMDM